MATLPVDGGTLWYEERGEGVPLVFVHGGWSNGDAWRAQLRHFADSHRVVTLDLRGHGRTGATDRASYSVELFTEDLRRLLTHLDATRPVLCGISLGSMVVQEYLARHPESVRGAVFAGAIQSMPPVALPAGVKPFLSPLPALSLSLSTTGPRTTFRTMLASIRTATGGPWLSLDPAVRARAMDAVGDVSHEEFLKVFDALYDYESSALSGVETPALVVHGASEAAPVKRQSARLAAAVADGDPTSIPAAAHLVNEDNPRAFNTVCEEFFGRLD
ncbi:alpha/beta fold hydrolase [Halobium salinum]|uniref:Alpha/beta fold hydrolase n=1 Tax=Halobium salinum TaxID=1364940 RepID=A0ABD5PAF4_9EURY|nr:alpha/beta hydrolase [Halobium salinum]